MSGFDREKSGFSCRLFGTPAPGTFTQRALAQGQSVGRHKCRQVCICLQRVALDRDEQSHFQNIMGHNQISIQPSWNRWSKEKSTFFPSKLDRCVSPMFWKCVGKGTFHTLGWRATVWSMGHYGQRDETRAQRFCWRVMTCMSPSPTPLGKWWYCSPTKDSHGEHLLCLQVRVWVFVDTDKSSLCDAIHLFRLAAPPNPKWTAMLSFLALFGSLPTEKAKLKNKARQKQSQQRAPHPNGQNTQREASRGAN